LGIGIGLGLGVVDLHFAVLHICTIGFGFWVRVVGWFGLVCVLCLLDMIYWGIKLNHS
jgi:hypothetical protein